MTDEQLREQFEEVRGKGYPDHVNEYLFQRDEFDNYVLSDINSQWHGWRMAYRSRDAEVQALREALTYALHVLECLKAESHNPMLPHSRWKSVDMARAALEQEAAE